MATGNPLFANSGVQSPTRKDKMTVPWKRCFMCKEQSLFKSPREFVKHLRELHCTKEGGSFVCHYGLNGICPSLPLEGVSDRDYEDHVARDHVATATISPGSHSDGGVLSSQTSTPCTSPISTMGSNEPSIVQDQYKWTIYMSQVNLPAALNDPRLSRRETDFFTKTWGDSFEKSEVPPSPHLLAITRDHFKKYTRKVSVRLKEHAKNRAPMTDTDTPEQAFPVLQAKKYDKYRAELEAIPKIYMHPGFTLENPDTFNAVFPWTQIENARQDNPSKTRQSSKLLQEKLSHYLDLVEVQIAKQIALRSEAFFEAMTSHDELQEHMSKTCDAIKRLREKIQGVDVALVQGPLKIIEMQRKRSNYVNLFNKLKMVATVHQTQPTIQMLLSNNDFVGALDLICTTQEVLAQELAGIHSFRHLGSQLAEMEKVIGKMMQEDFVRYAAADLNRPLLDGATVVEEPELDDFGVPFELSEAQEKLVAMVLGMLRQHRYNFLDVYREEAFSTLKAIIKQTVIEAIAEADDIDTEGNVGSLGDQMRLLNYSQWMTLLHEVCNNLMVVLRRVKAVCCVMQEVIRLAAGQNRLDSTTDSEVLFEQTADGAPLHRSLSESSSIRVSVSSDVDNMITQSEFVKVSALLKEMMCLVCDHAHDRCVKLLVARAKDGFLEKLSSSEFVQLSRAIEGFVADCEAICGRKSTSLRAGLQSQASRFVNRFHDERKTKLSLILDNERWKQADVPAEFQDLFNYISAKGKLCLPVGKLDCGETRPQEYLSVDGEKYAVVGTVLMLIKMVVEYCACVEDLPTATSDILTRLIELLKMFNSRTCQLILGAGALQLVGLKTITTKNLALASRCLQLVVYYIPKVRTHFEERVQGKQVNMIKHFEHVLKDYNDHIAELANKLVFIMDNMLDANLAKWEVKAPMPSASFRSISKQMSKLHEAIYDLLPPAQVLELFQRIHDNFKLLLRSQLIRLGVTNNSGPQEGLVMADVSFYTGNIVSLAGLETLRLKMEDIWDKS